MQQVGLRLDVAVELGEQPAEAGDPRWSDADGIQALSTTVCRRGSVMEARRCPGV